MLKPSPPSSISSGSSRSFFTTSSSSTFSDISVSSLPSPPPSGSKTHAFFSSPFSTHPPTPPLPSIPIPIIDVSTPTPTLEIPEPTPRPKALEPDFFFAPPPGPDPDEPSAGTVIASTLRLIKPLGHGAFSSVWLADDLSTVPLVLRSHRSLRDIRRRASQKSQKSPSSAPATSLSRFGSLRKLRARVPGTRPICSIDAENQFESIPNVLDAAPPLCLSRASSTSSTTSSHYAPALPSTTSTHIARHRPPAISISHSSDAEQEHTPSSRPITPTPTPSPSSSKARLVAVKMTLRGKSSAVLLQGDDLERERTRVAFIREVEVLRHISHPNITPLLTHLTSPTHHLLVLPYIPGGDLLSLVNTDTAWARLRESVLKRMMVELCKAVGWMHGVGLVHRDIKLENILLTTEIYTTLTPDSPAPTLTDLFPNAPHTPHPHAPTHGHALIKLTDFGLSRFVDIRSPEERKRDRIARRAARRAAGGEDEDDLGEGDSSDDDEGNENGTGNEGPLLSTRCGSEAYAAPELVMAAPPPPPPSPPRTPSKAHPHPKLKPKPTTLTLTPTPALGVYDARETDAWACGVVLFALVGRRLPFGEGVGLDGVGVGGGRGIGREGEAQGYGYGGGRLARRAWLMRIARGEYEWPSPLPCEAGAVPRHPTEDAQTEQQQELMGPTLALSEGAQRVVGRLLVRDPRRRAKIRELWGDGWMGGDGVGVPVRSPAPASTGREGERDGDAEGDGDDSWTWDEEHEHEAKAEAEAELQSTTDADADADADQLLEEDQLEPMNEEELALALREVEEELIELVERERDQDRDQDQDSGLGVGPEGDGWLVDGEGIGDIARREVV